jgi:hypothetical protein
MVSPFCMPRTPLMDATNRQRSLASMASHKMRRSFFVFWGRQPGEVGEPKFLLAMPSAGASRPSS